ncbi:hypothetical protein ACR6C2_07445 [Streptomyces sp. INA 01156]
MEPHLADWAVKQYEHSGFPPRPYRCVRRWHTVHRPTWSLEHIATDGSSSVGGGAIVMIFLFRQQLLTTSNKD